MAEKRSGESSDSEVYLSADEDLGSSRGSGDRVKIVNANRTETTGEVAGTTTQEEEGGNGEEEEEDGEMAAGKAKEIQSRDERDKDFVALEVETDEKLTKLPRNLEEPGNEKDTVKEIEEEERGEEEEDRGEQVKKGDIDVHEEEEEQTEKKKEENVEKSQENEKNKDSGSVQVKKEEKEEEEKEKIEKKEKKEKKDEEKEKKEEEEKTPIPPPRRKRKKKLQKNPSLEDLEKLISDVEVQRSTRSMTVGSYDMSRERQTVTTAISPSSSTSKSPGSGLRGAEFSHSSPHKTVKPQRGKTPGGKGGRTDGQHRAVDNVPSISIQPDTNLELTEEMVHGQAEVMSRDTPHAKAYGSDSIKAEIIYDTDDESEGEGVYGSQELVPEPVPTDHSDSGPDGPTDPGQSAEVVVVEGEERRRGSEKEHKEKTPVAEEEEEEDETNLPSDNQILQMTIVKNLDTGDSFPLSVVNEKIPLGSNPLNQHLYRRTAAMESHGDEGSGEEGHHRRRSHTRRKKFKNFWGKKRTKSHGEGVVKGREGGDSVNAQDHDTAIKYKPSSHHKGPYEFDKVRLRQDLTGPHLGAVWAMEFSICGRLLAVAGQDSIVRVWVLRPAAQFFHELQAKYQRFGVHSSGESLAEKASMASTTSSEEDDTSGSKGPFLEQPICTYHGHLADVLDLSWSKNFFLLSSSMDKTVRLWHISRKECLCCFQHVDFVTAIAFHPRDDRYFLSGSLDGKLRLWNIPDKRVALWNEIEGVGSHLITAANFCMSGKLAVAGTYDGRCIFYETEHLKYHTQIHVKSRHGKNRGRKVSGIEPLPGEEKILVTTNDSRLRLYNLKDHSLSCKYKGGLNTSSQIRANFSRDGLSIICGSEDHFIYVWRTYHDTNKLASVRRDRNELFESFTTHHAPVTAAIFAPVPGITVDQGLKEVGQMIIAADYQGGIKVYVNSEKL